MMDILPFYIPIVNFLTDASNEKVLAKIRQQLLVQLREKRNQLAVFLMLNDRQPCTLYWLVPVGLFC